MQEYKCVCLFVFEFVRVREFLVSHTLSFALPKNNLKFFILMSHRTENLEYIWSSIPVVPLFHKSANNAMVFEGMNRIQAGDPGWVGAARSWPHTSSPFHSVREMRYVFSHF